MGIMKTILVPVDFSASTARVCAGAQALARLTGSRLILLHVLQPPTAMIYEFNAFDAGQLAGAVEAGEKYAARELAALSKRWQEPGLPVESDQVTGQPAPSIIDHAKEVKADYIVMGSHGHGTFYDLLVGSTTQGVLKKARCPVLVIPIAPAAAGKK